MHCAKWLWLLLFFGMTCTNDQPTEPNQHLFGSYTSSAFIEPGSSDGGVDVQASGGYIQLVLKSDYTFAADMCIPDSIGSNFSAGQAHYTGAFSVASDTLKFAAPEFVVISLKWDKDHRRLESFEAPPRGKPFRIVLDKSL